MNPTLSERFGPEINNLKTWPRPRWEMAAQLLSAISHALRPSARFAAPIHIFVEDDGRGAGCVELVVAGDARFLATFDEASPTWSAIAARRPIERGFVEASDSVKRIVTFIEAHCEHAVEPRGTTRNEETLTLRGVVELMHGFDRVTLDEFAGVLKATIGASRDYVESKYSEYLRGPVAYCGSRSDPKQGEALFALALTKAGP